MDRKERALTAKEKIRKEEFDKFSIQMENQGYDRYDLIVGITIVLHELIHGITWSCFIQNRMKDIEFGVVWKSITPYCTCRKPLKKGQYITGALMPTVFLGFLPAIVSIISGSLFAFAVAELMIMSGGGDFLIVAKTLRYRAQSRDTLFRDHPYEAGLVVFDKMEETN